ncbi:MAG: hypothetical protein WB729_06045 [Candidatus Sulfotelmatobacter sp.]
MSSRLLKNDFSLVVASTYWITGNEQSQGIGVAQGADRVFQQPARTATEFLLVSILCASIVFLSNFVMAQDPAGANVTGHPVAFNAASSSSSSFAYSPAYIDASTLYYNNYPNLDICQTINQILTGANGVAYPSAGIVVDARGILEGQGAGLCQVNPFDSVVTSFQTTILLPATTIATECPWVLPSYTRIIGEGRGATTIAISGIAFHPDSTNSLIEMGSPGGGNASGHCGATTGYYTCPNSGCSGISIEHIAISPRDSGQHEQPYTAIYNNYAGDQDDLSHDGSAIQTNRLP